MNKQYYIYILSNYLNTTLYIGITNDLCKRIWEHSQEMIPGFTQKYHIHKLLYYESYLNPTLAIEREKQLKNWNRSKKNKLIIKMNPKLLDLYPELCT